MRGLGLDLRYAFRGLRRKPGFGLIAVLVLALGIGAATAMFSVVYAALLRPLPYPDGDRLVWVAISFPSVRQELMPGADYVEWREQNRVFEEMAAFGWRSYDLSGGGEPERLVCGRVTGNFLSMLGLRPALGRGFLPEEDSPGGPKAVILSHGLWQRRFGGDQDVTGMPVLLNGEPYTVAGVLPAHFRFPGRRKVDALVPQQIDAAAELNRAQMRIVHTVARLRAGVTIEEARTELGRLLDNNRQRFPKFYREDNQAIVVPLHEYESSGARTSLLVLFGAVGLLLLIACTNVASLLLVRAATRTREMALRSALGAGRARVARLLLAESGLLGVIGGAIGVVFAGVGLQALARLAPDGIPGLEEASIDGAVLGFAVGVSILTSLLFGLVPIFGSGKLRLRERLQEGGGQPDAASAGRLRGSLVVGELALSFVLLTAAALLLQSLWRLTNVQLGFEPEHIVTTWIQLNPSHYGSPERRIGFWEEVLERSARIPGMEAVAVSTGLPPQDRMSLATFSREGKPPPELGHRGDNVIVRGVSPDYFRAMGVSLRQGRLFSHLDREGSPLVGVINEALARRYFSGEDPLGHGIMGHLRQDWKGIVGVVANSRNDGIERDPQPEMYVPYRQAGNIGSLDVIVRSAVQPDRLIPLLRDGIRAVDPSMPLTIQPLEDHLAQLVSRPRFHTLLLAIFAAMAIVLAAVGVYGVVSYSVAQRTREIGIRIALGATSARIVRNVLWRIALLTGVGTILGIGGSLAAGDFLGTLLFEIQPNDPWTLAAIALLLGAVAMLAGWLPARRAGRVNPIASSR